MLDMQYDFIKFEGPSPRGDTKIAINKSGLIRLSSSFCREVQIFTFGYAILFYDKKNNAVAFKFTSKREAGAIKITRDKTAATLSVKSFLKEFNLLTRIYFRRYEWEREYFPELGGFVYIIKLNKQ